jgi:hypothetical protein
MIHKCILCIIYKVMISGMKKKMKPGRKTENEESVVFEI